MGAALATFFGDVEVESADDALPQDPAEWLASLGASSADTPEESSDAA